ncbi:MAG: hypothetical protein M1823_000265 [Watsoniomyces obsoletus]|nr:MAG: hypothetical protein M1823_000265 [Watsoniomyces obsoletus]
MGRSRERRAYERGEKNWNHHDVERPSVEEFEYDDMNSSDPSSPTSSRTTSASFQPMLPKPRMLRSSRATGMSRFPLPSRTSRFLCLILSSTIIVLIFTLFQMSVLSSRRLQMGGRPSPPAAWESFPLLQRYYGGLRTLVGRDQNTPEWPRGEEDGSSSEDASPSPARQDEATPKSSTFHPYPAYSSSEYLAEFMPVRDCLVNSTLNRRIPSVRAYTGIPQGFPDPAMGSSSVLGLRDDVCFERYGRLGPYGYGYGMWNGGTGAGLHGDRDGVEAVWAEHGQVNYKNVRWAELQERCGELNEHRFRKSEEKPRGHEFSKMEEGHDRTTSHRTSHHDDTNFDIPNNSSKTLLPRTAVIVRTWSTIIHTTESMLFLRSLITELSLLSGGEYDVHILVHVRDDNLQIWANETLYQETLQASLPEEFWGLGTLWTERQMGLIYGGLDESFYRGLPVHGVYRSSFLPVQWFAQQHPEYEHFWHWEMDARYTGHYYHLLDRVRRWAKEQPRKGLWERNSRFYIPSEHGTWEDFKQMVRVQTQMSSSNGNTRTIPESRWSRISMGRHDGKTAASSEVDTPVWGPVKPNGDLPDATYDIYPPTSYDKDKYEWGVNEEADFITFNPLFDPSGTTWLLADDVTGYNISHGNSMPPRRASVITVSRLSKRLLNTMHHDTTILRRTMFSEMWPASCALHHGLKAVTVPHPVYVERNWPTGYLAATFNAGRHGSSGGARTSVFGEREHNFKGTTWYYKARFAPNLWRRWLGFRVDGNGGEEEEVAGEGRMCLPGLLVHPVKQVGLIIEGGFP